MQFFTVPTPGTPNGGGSGFQFTALTISQGMLRLEWRSETGRSYRIEYKNTLEDASWTLLRTVDSEGDATSTMDEIAGQHRFYRVVEE